MAPRPGPFVFRRFAVEDFALLSQWLLEPHVRSWFGDPDEWLGEIRETFAADWVEHFFVLLPDGPAGFVQRYDCRLAPSGPWSAEPPGTIGIDYLLGRPELIGKGLGTRLIRSHVAHIQHDLGPRRIIADPDAANAASIGALAANGFALDSGTGLYVRPAF
ncbi:MAG: GNAT family N-acetyltransferase [Humidesulfovibrio sp.]|uniref:GNAT family N-acetyltransferase n=1 Tax=Humidesulfovibrio sp. TaxID=2910988 RepID=UPI0027324534|nr:GNAT family N-acetyltransferase [Humidesulfovibrio sp.]MDP2849040.1 GNAT family N-acetyltransferase [Humidesulfovibrio sp.]